MSGIVQHLALCTAVFACLVFAASCALAVPVQHDAHYGSSPEHRVTLQQQDVDVTQQTLVHGFIKRKHPQKKHHRQPGGPGVHTHFKWTPRNIAAAVCIAICAMLANAVGIGGGPLFVPILATIVGMDLRLVPGLSHTIITSGAIASCGFGLAQRSPVDPDKPLMSFDIALTLVPAILFGVSFGVLVAPVIPEWLQTALLTVLLAYVASKTLAKGQKQRQKERSSVQPVPPPTLQEGRDGTQEPLLGGSIGHRASLEGGRTAADLAMSAAEAAAAEVSAEEAQQASFSARVPWAKVAALVALWVGFLMLQLAKAQNGRCSWRFAFAVVTQAVLLAIGATAYVIHQSMSVAHGPGNVDPQLRKLMSLSDGGGTADRKSTLNALTRVATAVAAAGFVAGLLGVGGAILFNPLLLELGVQPQVAASTAILIVLFGSSSVMLSYWFNGMLNLSYAAAFAPIAFCSALLGVSAVGWAVRRSGRASILVLLMAGVIATGGVATAVFGGQRAWHDFQHGDIGFRSFCAA